MSDPHGFAMSILDPPASNGGAPPGTIRLHPARGRPLPQPVRRSFRRNFLDRQDPFESAGREISDFTFSGSYELLGEPPEQVAHEIRAEMVQELVQGNLASTNVEILDFNDEGAGDEPPRRFIVSHTDTTRQTLVTVNAYLQPYGEHLYYSVRSYLLPPLSIRKLLLALLFTFVMLTQVDNVPLLGVLLYSDSGMKALFFGLVVVSVVFRKLIGNLLAGDTLLTALRKQFPKQFDWGTFNNDDVSAFLKTNLKFTLGTIARVLERHGIEATGLQAVVQNLQTVNINNSGGSIVGAVIGGAGNRATGQVRK